MITPWLFWKFWKFWKFGMKLTRRQEEFIANLVDLNQELNGPIHYSLLAERLGVSPFTAYDMLNLLEEKGAVNSEYQLAADKNGPGRAERLFYPATSIEVHPEDPNPSTDIENDEITYCVDVMNQVATRMRRCPARKILLEYLPDILPANQTTRENLTLLGGFTFGILAQENCGAEEWTQKLLDRLQSYLKIVNRISSEACDQLAGSLTEVFQQLTQEA
jgi:hypothetical protein